MATTAAAGGAGRRFRRAERLRSPSAFQALLRRGARSDGPLLVLIGSARPAGASRLGLTVSRRVGSAVCRNRVKRRLRECFRRNKPERPLDVMVIAKREILDAGQAELDAQYGRQLRELLRRLAGARDKGALGRR